MAYVPNQNEDEQNQQNQQGTQSVQQLSGQTSNIGSSGTNTFNQAQQRQDVGTGFTNINRYLEENEPQSQRMTGQITSNIEETGRQAREGIQESQNLFNQGVQSQTQQFDEDLFNQIDTDATGIVEDEDRFNQVIQQRDAEYTGPDTFEESEYYQPTFNRVQQAQQTADKVLSDVGRKDLASELNPEGRTTRGMGTLDNLFLSGEQPRQQLFQTRESFADLPDRLQETSQFATQAVQGARTTNQATREAAQEALERSRDTFQSDIDTRLEDALSRSEGIRDTISTGIETGADLTDDQLAAAGISRDDYDDFLEQRETFYGTSDLTIDELTTPDRSWVDYEDSDRKREQQAYQNAIAQRQAYQDLLESNIEPSMGYEDYITYTDPALSINRSNVATTDDYARQRALEQLLGNDIGYITNEDVAGTANLDTTDVDFTNLIEDYEALYSPVRDQYTTAQQAYDDALAATDYILPRKLPTGTRQLREAEKKGMQALEDASDAVGDTFKSIGSRLGF